MIDLVGGWAWAWTALFVSWCYYLVPHHLSSSLQAARSVFDFVICIYMLVFWNWLYHMLFFLSVCER